MIGIFDSGVGGLTVLKAYLRDYPQFDYLYLGDQANAPYGNHSQKRLKAITASRIDFLVRAGCRLIIVACNSASAEALRHVQSIYQGTPPILGVLVPAAQKALSTTRTGRIGIIGTRATVHSGAYERELMKYAPETLKPRLKIYAQATPLLVPLIEEGMGHHPITRKLLRTYLRPLKSADIDTLILGCTHYPLLQDIIEDMMGKRVAVISSAEAATEKIADYFERHPDVPSALSKGGTRRFITTDAPDRFSALCSVFLGRSTTAELCSIPE